MSNNNSAGVEDTSFSGRLGGLFKKSNVASKQEQELHALQAELQAAVTNERKAKDQLQQLELEKVLLQNFVDQVMGDDDDDEAASAAEVKTQISNMTSKNAELTLALEKTRQEKEELESKLHQTERKCTAFETALNNVQNELREGDAKLKDTAEKLNDQNTQDQVIQRLTDELEAKTNTLEELMARVSKIDDEKKRSEQDFKAILEKTQGAQQTALEELEGFRAKTKTLSSRVDELEKEKGDLIAAPSAPQVDAALMISKVQELEEQSKKELDELEAKLKAAEDSLKEEQDARTEESAAAEEEHKKLTTELEQVKDDLDHLQAMLMKKDNDLNSTETALQEAEVKAQEAAGAAAEAHAALEKQLTETEDVVAFTRKTVEERDGEIETLKQEVEEKAALQEELDALQEGLRDRDEQIQELEGRIVELENQGKLSQRKNANIVKELQQQVMKLQRNVNAAQMGAHVDPEGTLSPASQPSPTTATAPSSMPNSNENGSGEAVGAGVLEEENAQLIGRVASLQQEVWVLSEAKKSYEEEMVRLNEVIAEKNVIITAHFYDMAQKYNKDKGKFGATFFKPSQEEVHARLQASLEESMSDNIRLQGQLRDVSKDLERAMRVVALAEEEGLVVQDSDMEDSLDDSYDGTFE